MSHTSNNDVKLTPAELASLQKWASLPTTSHNAFDNAFSRMQKTSPAIPVAEVNRAVPVAEVKRVVPVTEVNRAVAPPPLSLDTKTYFPRSSSSSSPPVSPSTLAKEKELEMREQRIRQVLEMQSKAAEQRVNHDTPVNIVHRGGLPIGVVHHGSLPFGVVHHGGIPVGFVHHNGLPFGVVHHGGIPFGVVHHDGIPVGHHNGSVHHGHRKNFIPEQRHEFTPSDSSIGLSRIAPHLVRF